MTQDLWDQFHSTAFEKEHFDIPPLGIVGDTLSASNTIVSLTWQYTDKVKKEIMKYIKQINLPSEFVSVHIRRGDKHKETENIDISTYLNKLKTLTSIKDVFVATDDYEVITYLNGLNTDYIFYHLTERSNIGYDQTKFEQMGDEIKFNELVKLFASIEVMANSKIFIGTLRSNIGMFMAMRLGKEKVYGVDIDDWGIW